MVTIPKGGSLKAACAFVGRHADWLAARLDARPQPTAFADGALVPIRGVPHRLAATGTLRGLVRIHPAGEPAEEADDALPRLLVPGAPERFSPRVADFLRKAARADLEAAVARHARALGRTPQKIVVRDTTSRWGSCSSLGVLSFSWRLILAPPLVLDYLAAHEVAHLAEMNHGPRFWAHCTALCPETETARAWLKAHGAGLHAYG
ncbi:hypothetical protein A6302_00343 [Methylobrevis pamukkalensis]|uniref:YgjP-like metallopeptidase domain-containing protein n=1 Tax=Methylobrevis pamukkalensis TaxID=1439726 RepID=A0A1E3H7G8_9HYPH|nr:hypothetical protein A6302_00343 [Methylobrevis pamukkalensis]